MIMGPYQVNLKVRGNACSLRRQWAVVVSTPPLGSDPRQAGSNVAARVLIIWALLLVPSHLQRRCPRSRP